jgi:spore germination protein YaaH
LQVMGSLPSGKTLSPEAAPELTVLNPAGFSLQADGSVTGDEPPPVPGAQYDVLPAVVASNGDATEAVSSILSSPSQEAAHINALLNLAGRPGNDGVELDYTAVPAQDRQAFVDFVSSLAAALHKSQHELILELPAPTLVGSGWNTGSYDWGSLAKVADFIKLVPPIDESVYRKQMPDLLKFLISEAGVDPAKIILVTTPYSIQKSDVSTTPLTRLDALSIASQIQVQNRDQAVAGSNVTLLASNLDHDAGGSGLIWDDTTATVSFVYKVGDATHVVWIENQFSEAFKLEYAEIYHLGGVAVDDASNDPSLGDVWPAITQFVATGTPELEQPNPGLLVPTWIIDGKPLASDGKTVWSWASPPQPGDHTVSLMVSDGVVRVMSSTQVTLRAATGTSGSSATGAGAAFTATPRPPPLTATPAIRPAATATASATSR